MAETLRFVFAISNDTNNAHRSNLQPSSVQIFVSYIPDTPERAATQRRDEILYLYAK